MASNIMSETAFIYLTKKNKKVKFLTLWNDYKKKAKLESDDQVADFYTALTLDGRLVNVGNNEWQLRTNTKYDDIKNEIEEEEIIANDDDDEIETSFDENGEVVQPEFSMQNIQESEEGDF